MCPIKNVRSCYPIVFFFCLTPPPYTQFRDPGVCTRLLGEPLGFGVKPTSIPSLKLPKYYLHQNVIPQKFWKQVKLMPVNTVICMDWATGLVQYFLSCHVLVRITYLHSATWSTLRSLQYSDTALIPLSVILQQPRMSSTTRPRAF